jgi:hypothetical protein
LEDLSEASFLGKLLVLPANVRLGWKLIARYKHSGLFGLFICNEEKRFIKLATGDAQGHRHPDRELGGENSGFEQTGFLTFLAPRHFSKMTFVCFDNFPTSHLLLFCWCHDFPPR